MDGYGWYGKFLRRSHNYQPVQNKAIIYVQQGLAIYLGKNIDIIIYADKKFTVNFVIFAKITMWWASEG